MWREVLFLIAVIGCVASQTENPNKDDNLNDKEIDNAQANENPVDVSCLPLSAIVYTIYA